MDQNSSIQDIWLIIVIWSFIYLADYYLTIFFARKHKEYLYEYIGYEGSLEITPEYQKDVDKLRRISPQFTVRWLISVVMFYVLWWLWVEYLEQPQIFYFFVGALILREVAIHLRHIQNLSVYPIAKSGGLKGRIEYSRWATLKLSAVEMLSFSLMYFLLAILLRSWFLLGGAFGCVVVGIQHWNFSRKALSSSKTPPR